MSGDQLYRAEDTWYSVSNEWGEHDHSELEVKVRAIPILRRTPKGAWIRADLGGEQFVLLTARKKFACETKEEALRSLVARRERQESIYLARAGRARDVINRAKEMLGEVNPWLN